MADLRHYRTMSSQFRTLTIHIGAPKTGSSYVQRLLYDNRQALLRDQGILYPEVSLRGFGHHDLAFLTGGGYPDWAIPQDRPLEALQADLHKAVSAHDGSIVLSSENFYLFPDPAQLKHLLLQTGASTGREIHILVYIRRQDDAHESWYNQTVKAQGAAHTIDECINRHFGLWDYHARLERWAAAFGAGSLRVRRFHPAAFSGGSLRGDFLQQAGIVEQGLTLPPEEVNWSLNRDLLAFQRLLNRLPLAQIRKRHFHRQLMALSRHAAGQGWFDESPLLTPAGRREIMARYETSNAAIAREFLGGEPAFPWGDDDAGPGSAAGAGLTLRKLLIILHWLLRHG